MYYLQSRYYDPRIGRWLNGDEVAIGAYGSSAQSDLFNYCLNDPVQYRDPSGFLPTWAKIAIGIAGIIASVALTIATGGAALPALIATLQHIVGGVAISMAMGGLIGYITGGVSGLKKGLLDGALDGFMWGGIGAAVSIATKLIKGTKAFVAIKNAVTQSRAVRSLINSAGKLKYTKTVMKHINDRPYMKSTVVIREIMKAARPVADNSLKNGYKWVVEGFVIINGKASTGVWELVIDATTKTVVHFLFKS